MSRKLSILLMILVLFTGLIFPAAAQDMLEETLDGGYTLLIPDDWKFEREEDGDEGYYYVDEDIELYVLGPVELATVIKPEADASVEDVLNLLIDEWLGEDFEAEGLDSVEEDGLEVAYWVYINEDVDGNQQEGVWYVVKLEDDSFAFMDFSAELEVLGQETDLIVEIVSSLQPAEDTDSSEAASGEACTVSTTEANTVQLRVGPGTNRSVFAFLPARTDFTVTGQAEADDESLWFQLDKAEVAPDAGASEVWINADDVETEGDCDAVGAADAPPIIPAQQSAPPAANPGSGDNNAAAGGNVPSSGNWRLSFGSELVGSCAGSQTIRFSAQEAGLDTSPTNGFVSVNGGGASINFGGAILSRTAPGRYSGTFDVGGGTNSVLSLTVVSATQMVGRVDINLALDDGTRCSVGFDASANRN